MNNFQCKNIGTIVYDFYIQGYDEWCDQLRFKLFVKLCSEHGDTNRRTSRDRLSGREKKI